MIVKNIGECMKSNVVYQSRGFMIRVIALLVCVLLPPMTIAESSGFDYRLGAGDKISIRVFGEDDLSTDTLISTSGALTYPFLGEIKVEGLTVSELEKNIDGGLRGEYLINPNVSVSILEYRPFFIQGEVEAPGAYAFQPGLNISKAITVASGFTERASRKKLYIIRANDPEQKEREAKMSEQVRPGDMIVVHESFF